MNTQPYSIRYWPTWLGLGLLWCLTRLPYSWQTGIGRLLGNTFRLFASSRRHIAQVNFSLCFPELSEQERQQLLVDHFRSLGIAIMETAMSWWATDKQLEKLVKIDGLQHLHDALQDGKGVILLSAHFTTLEIGGRLLALHTPFHVMYRKHKNPVIERVMRNARIRNFDKAIPRKDLRTFFRHTGSLHHRLLPDCPDEWRCHRTVLSNPPA
jgi:KDO2-lipid IV(A) lauroyltransferase